MAIFHIIYIKKRKDGNEFGAEMEKSDNDDVVLSNNFGMDSQCSSDNFRRIVVYEAASASRIREKEETGSQTSQEIQKAIEASSQFLQVDNKTITINSCANCENESM